MVCFDVQGLHLLLLQTFHFHFDRLVSSHLSDDLNYHATHLDKIHKIFVQT